MPRQLVHRVKCWTGESDKGRIPESTEGPCRHIQQSNDQCVRVRKLLKPRNHSKGFEATVTKAHKGPGHCLFLPDRVENLVIHEALITTTTTKKYSPQ